jgi:hypothetical protein
MKKTVFFGLLVILLAIGFIGCDNGNNNDPHDPLIGTWEYSEANYHSIITFFDDNTWLWTSDGSLESKFKGTWSHQGLNTAVLIETHEGSTIMVEIEESNRRSFTCEILTSTSIEIDWGGGNNNKIIYTFVE